MAKRTFWNQYTISIIFILPAFCVFFLFLLLPVTRAVQYSFTDWNGISKGLNYIGLENYIEFFTSENSYAAIGRTFLLAGYVVIIQNAIALLFAEFIDSQRKGGTRVYKIIFFAPSILSTIIVAFLWNYMYSPVDGVLKIIFTLLNMDALASISWLANPDLALFSIGNVMIWQFFGYTMVIYFAGMQSISNTYYDAAKIDGANSWQVFWKVKFPLIASVFTINIILSVMGALKQFEHIFLMTNGGPGRATETISIMIYNQAFGISRMGYGTAVSMILLVMILLVSSVQLKFLQARETRF
ncbi:MAG: sugar ABC transporter permease [Spirochaetia bacterium]|nr:sugar ABC transporter permease [Spirochaetia bacterium]